MYPRFQITKFSAPVPGPVQFTILGDSDNPWGNPVIILDEEVRVLKNLRLLEGHIYEAILYDIIARIRSHFLIHAGVITYNDQAVIIVADSKHGKTTTVLELVRRGFKFLSDEMAALGRLDHQVYPFPRSLRIRPDTLERVGFAEAAIGAPVWLDKLILDIETIQPDSLGAATTISHIVILQNPTQSEQKPNNSNHVFSVYVDHLDDELLATIGQIKGVSKVCPQFTLSDYPQFTLQATHRVSVFSQIQAICRERETIVLGVSWGEKTAPVFNEPARLQAIPKSQAAMSLLHQFLPGSQSTIPQDEFKGNSTQLFMELATLIGQARCYKLSVGPLNQMANLICDLFDR
jgi:hypothetical protein